MGDIWHMIQCRMMLDFRRRSSDMIMEEELRVIQDAFSTWLDERYGESNVDLCHVTHQGMYDEDLDPHPEGWGMDEDEIWDRIPGETQEEKRAWIEQNMEGEEPDWEKYRRETD
jgi:hypothetical protein